MRRPSVEWVRVAAKLAEPRRHWSYSRALRAGDPAEGWKIHVSATIFSASDVLHRALRSLKSRDALFKIPSSLEVLVALNAGISDYHQVGKFLTVYPRSTEDAVELARELHQATRGLAGPSIPSDLPYRRGSLVHYRYGAFRDLASGVHDRAGKRRPDRKTSDSAVPPWLVDPFAARRRRSVRGALLGSHCLPFGILAQRGKGCVYEALDVSVSPPRQIIVKEGRRHGDNGLDGRDGSMRVRHEGRVLRALRRGAAAVPEVLREFTHNRHRYLALEQLRGRTLSQSTRMRSGASSWRRAQRLTRGLQRQLDLVHRAGWVWRDCKPDNILTHRDYVYLIDFEGACRVVQTDELPWGAPDYVPPRLHQRSGRSAGWLEDDYALGVIAFQLGTGRLPPLAARQRRRILRQADCPAEFARQIEQLLAAGR